MMPSIIWMPAGKSPTAVPAMSTRTMSRPPIVKRVATWAVTGETTTRFDQPVLVGDPYRVVATITEMPTASSSTLRAEAEILDRQGLRCAASTATFVVLGEAHLAHASGLTGDQLAAVDSSPG